ncbi:MAG: YDG domain-containing protein, partial [Bacteroidales bacterium]|nr:YDG domain-containing protein [Bacteroidales bacterium]
NNKHIGTGKLLTPGSTLIDDGNGGANYRITYITAQSGTITKAPLNVTAQAATKVYDGTVISAIQPSVGLLQPGDAVTNAGMQVYDTKHVGTGKVMTPSGTVINDGNGGNNYQITYVPNSVGIITEKMVYVNAVTDSKVYDGTVASAASPIVIGIISPDYAGTFPTQVFDTEDAGTGKLLTASGMVISDGNGGNNYSVTYFTDNTGVITPKALTITAENKVKCYDGEVYGDGYTVVYSGFVTGEDEGDLNGTLGFTGTAVTAVDPGNYTIIPGGLTSGNYAINYVNGALAINALPAPAISGETAVYVNTTHSYSTPLVADHTYNWEITGGVIQGSQTGHEVTVLWGDTPGTGTLTVNEVITETGCQVTTEAYNVTISEWEYPVFTVNGVFTYYKLSNPLPMDNVTVNLKQGGTVIATTVTNASGFYEFPNIPDGTYSIEASTQKPHGGVNATDAGQVNYWWTHRTPIERVKWNAGNFYSSDNFMNATDAGQIRGYFLNGNPLSSQGYWTFWRQQQSSDANPPAGVSTFAVSGANTTVNYYGLCVGDFNMSYAMPPGMKAAYGNSAVSLVYEEPIMASAGAMVDVPFRVNTNMQVGAISMILNYPSELAVIESVVLSDGTLPEGATPVGFSVDGDELRIAWNDLVPLELSESGYLFTVRVRTTDLFTPGHTISFTLVEDPLNELADGQYEPIDNVMLLTRNIEASATGIDEGKEPMVTLEAYPNPFTEKVNIVYSLPAESQVWLEIDNIYGSRIAVLADEIRQPGTHKVNFDGISLNPGIYTVTLKTKVNGEIQIRTLKIVRGW